MARGDVLAEVCSIVDRGTQFSQLWNWCVAMLSHRWIR